MSEEEKSKALAVIPSNRDILRRYADGIATSPLDIKRGEAVFVDKNGVPFGQKGFRRRVLAYKAMIFAAGGVSGLLLFSGAVIPALGVYLVAIAPSLAVKYRGTGALMAIDVLARRGQLDEAQKRLDAVPHLRARNPVWWARLSGNIASHRGQHEVAIAFWREGAARAKGLARELMMLAIAKGLLLSGKVTEARIVLEGVKLPPEADEVLVGQLLANVMFALEDEMVDADQLHEWARKALAYSHTGVELAALGWAFERVGEADMAQLLAGEATERMHYPYLATWWPALQQWLDGAPK